MLVSTRCNDSTRADEWSAWYDDVHLPDLVRAGGARVATRFELTQKPVPGMPSIGFSHLAIYEFDGDEATERLDATLARDAELQRATALHPNHCVIGVDALLAHGRWTQARLPRRRDDGDPCAERKV